MSFWFDDSKTHRAWDQCHPVFVLDHLLADDTILLARQFCDCLRDRVDHFICFTGIDFV